MRIWGIHKKYKALSWWVNFMGDFVHIGPLVIFGANAMHWSVQFSTKKWGYICFSLPSIDRIKGKNFWYFYISPNATPWASTYYISNQPYFGFLEKEKAKLRKKLFGHGFNTNIHSEKLKEINEGLNIRYKLK